MRHEALFERRCGEYVISDDPARFDADAMHDFLEREAYWVRGRSREQTAVAAANSVVLGVYGPDGSMVGGARVVTDRVTFGYLSDVYVLDAHRGRGLGKAVVAAACEHPAVAGIRRLMLITADAHEMYRPLGFTELPKPEGWMELRPVPGDPTGGTGAAGGAGGEQTAVGHHHAAVDHHRVDVGGPLGVDQLGGHIGAASRGRVADGRAAPRPDRPACPGRCYRFLAPDQALGRRPWWPCRTRCGAGTARGPAAGL